MFLVDSKLLGNNLFESFACFEGRQLGRWNFNLLFGSWIDALSCSAFLYLKGTKATYESSSPSGAAG